MYGLRPWVEDDDEFESVLLTNFIWAKELAIKYKNKIRNQYFATLPTMSNVEIDEGVANVSSI